MIEVLKKTIVFSLIVILVGSTVGIKTNASELGEIKYRENSNDALAGMDEYIYWDDNGVTISLDKESARENGYSEEAILFVENNISNMNKYAMEGNVISDDYSVTVAVKVDNGKRLMKANNVKGVSKVTYSWNMTNIYLNSMDTFVFMMNFYKIYMGEMAVLTLCDNVTLFASHLNLASLCIKLVSAAIKSNYDMACNAASSGNGIIIQQVYF
jgi:hypothetical protein